MVMLSLAKIFGTKHVGLDIQGNDTWRVTAYKLFGKTYVDKVEYMYGDVRKNL